MRTQKRLKPWIKLIIVLILSLLFALTITYLLLSNRPHDDRLHKEGVDVSSQQELTDNLYDPSYR